jgi:hypothetical protein
MFHFLTGMREQYGSTRELLSTRGVSDEVFDELLRNLVNENAAPLPAPEDLATRR